MSLQISLCESQAGILFAPSYRFALDSIGREQVFA